MVIVLLLMGSWDQMCNWCLKLNTQGLQYEFNLSYIVRFMRWSCPCWLTIFVVFKAKLTWCWWSDCLPKKFFVAIRLTSSWKPLEPFSRSYVLLFEAKAREVYKWDIKFKIHSSPFSSRPSFPTSFCMLLTANDLQLGSQRFSRSQTSWMYVLVMPTIILFVSTNMPMMIYLGPTIGSNHFSSDRGHCWTAIFGSPQTRKMDLLVAARSFSMYSLKAEADRMSSS